MNELSYLIEIKVEDNLFERDSKFFFDKRGYAYTPYFVFL